MIFELTTEKVGQKNDVVKRVRGKYSKSLLYDRRRWICVNVVTDIPPHTWNYGRTTIIIVFSESATLHIIFDLSKARK